MDRNCLGCWLLIMALEIEGKFYVFNISSLMLFDTFGSLALREIFLIFNYFEYVAIAMLKI
jgi:hypothetical protein